MGEPSEPREPGVPPAPPGLVVLYADADLIALDKPAGRHTAPLRPGETGTMLGEAIGRFPEIAGLSGIKSVEPGLLHRLDRDTSGVVVVARNAAAFQNLRAQFRAGRVRKEYLALCVPQAGSAPVWPVQAGQRFVLESRFAPYGPGRRKVRVVPAGADGGAGREASPGTYRTEAEVLEARGPRVLVRAVIVRGFRHQVRAHLAHLGLPIAGDPLYGVPVPPGTRGRLYLHASAVELRHPDGGRPLCIRSPLPPDFGPCYKE